MDKSVPLDLTIVIVSFNTKELLRKCLNSLLLEVASFSHEIIVVDNGSTDGSFAMLVHEFPKVKAIESKINLGFAAANNVAFRIAKGRYIVILNTDAEMDQGALNKAYSKMETNPKVGLGGGKLIYPDGSWQPAARMYPSILNDFLCLSGFSSKYKHSSFFGRGDRTWASPDAPAEVDWIPGAFSMISHEALLKVGFFDERFFLYYEEVDLCKRLKQAGYVIAYWPDVVVTHLGGESAKTLRQLEFSKKSLTLTLWSLRSALLYYRKHHGAIGAYSKEWLELSWYSVRAWKNSLFKDRAHQDKVQESKMYVRLIKEAWKDTQGGLESPPRPW